MINNTASRKTLAAVLAVGMAAGLTGCGSTVAANTNDYFTNVSSILHTLQSNGSQQDAASSSTADAGNQLATPTDFTVDENGSYSFTGVEDGIVLEAKGFWVIGLVKVILEAIKNIILNAQLESRLRNS